MRQDGDRSMFVEKWSIPLERSTSNHLFAPVQFPVRAYFTRTQLNYLHKQFFHPSATKLYNLIKKARPEEVTPETLSILEDISKRCDPCQRITNAPNRFRVTLGAESVKFNERLQLDVMFLDGKPVLPIVDEGTKFSAARFLPDQSTKTIWSTILKCWSTIYTGLPHKMLVDQGTNFDRLFINMAAQSNVEVQKTAIEAHSSLGFCERFHQPLRTIYRKIMASHSETDNTLALSLAVKAMNDTLGPEGFVPSALVFGEYPEVHTKSETPRARLNLQQRSELATSAREECQKIMAKMKVSRALRHKTSRGATQTYEVGSKVLVWRERAYANRIGEWIGPFSNVDVDYNAKQVYIRDCDFGPARPFSLWQVKP